jgi:CCR4-NOT transcription complex subunit 9
MVEAIKEQPSQRLLKHIVRCFLRISEHSKGKDFLKKYIPAAFKEGTLVTEDNTRRWVVTIMSNIGLPLP